MGSREKAPGNDDRNRAGLVAKVGAAAGVVAAAGVAAAVAKRRKRPKEVHASQRERVRDLQTYDIDEQGRTPEEIATVLQDSQLKDKGALLPEVAVLIHFASTSTAGGTTFAKLRYQIDETIDDEAIQTAVTYLKTNGLIMPDPEHDKSDGQPVKYLSTRALAWAMDQGSEDFHMLAHATNKVIMNGLGAAEEF